MSSDKYTWISTDRKSEAEVLKELAAADTPMVIVSRDEPEERINRYFESLSSSKVLSATSGLLDVPRRRNHAWLLAWKLPLQVYYLIGSAWQACFLFDGRRDPKCPAPTQSFDDWILARRLSGEPIHVVTLESEVDAYRPLRDFVPRTLMPTKSNISEFLHTQIDRLAGLELATDSIDAIALRAGIYLWHDAMDESHELAQSIEGQGQPRNGDYVHAILHRREPDYGNAKYWFRHVGRHPNFERLGQEAGPLIEQHAPEWKSRLLKGGWDPFAFVDFCEQAVATKNPQWIACAELIQEIELLLLLASTARHGP